MEDESELDFDGRWDKDEMESIEIDLGAEGSDPVSRFADNFPVEIKSAVEGINGDLQYAVLYILLDEGRKSFSQLKEQLDVHQQSLTNALNKLHKGSLVNQIDSNDISERYNSFYEVTAFGEQFIHSLFDSLGDGDGNIMITDTFVSDPKVDGMVFSSYNSIEKSGSSGTRVKISRPEVAYGK